MKIVKILKNILMVSFIIAATALFIAGPILACHATFFQMIYGGVIDIINGVSINPWDAIMVAEGVLKILLCAVPGVITLGLTWCAGMACLLVHTIIDEIGKYDD